MTLTAPHPAEPFIRAELFRVLADAPAAPLAPLVDRLAAQDVQVDEAYLARLAARLSVPPGFDWRVKDVGTRRTLIENGVDRHLERWTSDERAHRLFACRRPREFAETLLCARLPARAVARGLTGFASFPCSAQTVEVFAELYFDVGRMTRRDLLLHLDEVARLAAERATDDPVRRKELVRRAKEDPRRRGAACLPTEAALPILLLALGYAPPAMNVDRLLAVVHEHAALRLTEATFRGDQAGVREAAGYGRVLESVQTLMDGRRGVGSALKDVTTSLRLVQERRPIPNVHDLGGGHSAETLASPPPGDPVA